MGTQDPAARFGARIRRERKARGWNGARLAAAAGLTGQNMISRMERGVHEPGVFRAAAVARALGVSLDALLADPVCAACDDAPPAGLPCGDCGTRGSTP